MRIRTLIAVCFLAAAGPLSADDANVPAGSRTVPLGEHPYAIRASNELADANDLAGDPNVLLALRDADADLTVRIYSPPADPRATVLSVAKWYDAHLANRLPDARKTHANWLTIEETNALYRQARAKVDGAKRQVHAMLFADDEVQFVIEAIVPPAAGDRAQRVLLSLHRLSETSPQWVSIGKTGYRFAPPTAWTPGKTPSGGLRYKAPGGKVVLDVNTVKSGGARDPNKLVELLAAAFGKEMDKADGHWTLAARQELDRPALQGRLQYFLGRPDDVPSDLLVLHAVGGKHLFTLTAALPAGVRKQYAKELVAAMMSLRAGTPPSQTEYRPMTVRRAGLRMQIPEGWSTDDAGAVVKAIAPKDSPAAGTVLTVQVQPRSAEQAKDLASAVDVFRRQMKKADGKILADTGAKAAGLKAHLFEAVTRIDGKAYRTNYLYLERDRTLCLVSYFTPEGKYTATRPHFVKALRTLQSFQATQPPNETDKDAE
ncbi:MAG: hypothetical protein ACOCZU_02155 [Planctomycetota bacterium]